MKGVLDFFSHLASAITVHLALISGQTALFAADIPESVELPTYQVMATAAESAIDLQSAGVDVVTFERTERALRSTIGEALAWEPGVSSSFYGAGASRPMLRGMDGYRVGVLEGGLATGDLSAGSPDHAVAIEPLFIRNVTVHRGAAALLHGGGAIGGAVDTEPDYLPIASMPQALSGEGGLALESVNSGHTAWVKAGYRDGSWALRINLLNRQTDDYAIPGQARTPDYDVNNRIRLPPGVQGLVAPNPQGKVPNTATHTQAAALGAAWLPQQRQVRGAYQHYQSNYGVPLDGHTHGNPYGKPGVTGPGVGEAVTIKLVQDRVTGDAFLRFDDQLFQSLSLKGAWTGFRQQEWEGRFLSNDFQQESAETLGEARWTGDFWQAFLGAGASRQKFANRNLSYGAGRVDQDLLETRSITWSAFLLAEANWKNTVLRAGTRLDHRQARRLDLDGYWRADCTPSFLVEIVQTVRQRWEFVLAVGLSNRLPNADELYIEAPHGATGIYQIPQPQLGTEQAKSVEMRIARTADRLSLILSTFARHFNGFIFLENQGYEIGGLTAYALVQRKARFYGGELTAKISFYQEQNNWFGLELFADAVHAEDEEKKEPLPRIPPMRCGGRIKADWRNWSAGAHTLHALRQERVPREVFGTLAYQSPSEAYTLLTLELERRFDHRYGEWKMTLQVSNLFNEEARQHTSFLKDVAPLPGRNVRFTVGLVF